MKSRITEQSFYTFLKCARWFERDFLHGDSREHLLKRIQDEGLLTERKTTLLSERKVYEITSEDMDEAALETLEQMKQGAETIASAVLTHEHFVGRPDLLEKVEGKSELGDWYYVAVDIKRSRHLKDEYKFQGVFYAELLNKIQNVKPQNGYVMHSNGVVDSYSISEFQVEYDLLLEQMNDVLHGERKPHFLTSACKQSPWFSECESDTRECGHLSLINRIWRSEVEALERGGIKTVEELANASRDTVLKVSGITSDRAYFLQQQAIAITDQEVKVVGQIEFPEDGEVALTIDIESDPLRDVHYLFGVLVSEKDGSSTYHPFLAKDPSEEEQAWHAFIEFVAEYQGAFIYHYGWYEQDVFRKMAEKYGIQQVVQQMFDEKMIDVLTRMREKVIFPTPFYSLKDIAKSLGFRWRSSDASGLDSILWYNDWLQTGDEKILKKIVNYNEDDVQATWFVREWARKQGESST